MADDGALTDVLWDGPAFDAGLAIGARLIAVGDRPFTPDELRRAARAETAVELTVAHGARIRRVMVACPLGPRFPHLERMEDARPQLDEILTPLPSAA